MLHDLIAEIPELDLTYPHAAVTLLCAVAAFWIMQCLTMPAGLRSSHARGHLYLRLALALLSIGLAFDCYLTIQADIEPWWPDTMVRALMLLTLVTVPYALPPHLRGAHESEFETLR